MSELARRIAELSPEKRELLLQRLNQQKEDVPQVRIRPHSRISNAYPLSFAQQRLWFLHQLEPESPLYNVPIAMRLTGILDLRALEQSLNEIVRRHETLRTTFTMVDDQPMQVIVPLLRLSLSLIDLRAFPDREAEVQHLAAQEAWRPFDLVQGPLLRISVLRLSQKKHVLLLTLHHIVSDGWSQGVLLRELSIHYQALLQQQPSPLPPLPIQYVDYALWQRRWLQDLTLEHHLTYWRQQLQGAPTLLDLPTYQQRPAVQTHHGAQYNFLLSKALSDELKALSQREGVTLFMTLLTAFAILLSRYSGQDDVLIGSPIANRTHREVENLIGFFVNTLVLRCQLSDALCFRDALAQMREVTLAAYAHQDLPFEQLVEALAPERRLSHAPLVQVLFALQNTPPTSLRLTDLLIEQLAVEGNIARFDLGLAMAETHQGLRGALEYNTDLFEEASIRRLHEHFQTLLEGIVARPDCKVADLPLLNATECDHLLHIGFEPAAAQQYQSPHRLFEQQARRHPDAIALCWQEGQLSYAQLNVRSNQLAHGLLLLGLRPQQPVALLLTSGPLAVMALLGVLKAAGAFVCLDPQAPHARLQHLLTELQPGYLLTENRYAAEPASFLQEGHTGNVLLLDQLALPHAAAQWADAPALAPPFVSALTANPDLPEHPEAMAYIAYTSGSTGTPKGIAQSHRNLSQFSSWFGTQFDFGPSKRVAQWAALTFDASSVEIFATLMAGATLCLPPSVSRADAPALLDWLNCEQITLLQTVPSFLSVLLQTASQQAHSFSSLEFLLVAGEVLPVAVAQVALIRFATQTRLFNLYGPTEATLATYYEVANIPSGQRSIPVGRPIPGRHILILDRALHPCPIGVVGELSIASSYLASGYFQRPQETQAVFLPNPLPGQTERVYRTGDLARWLPDGTIEFVGRKDRQIKLRGMRVELEEIEAVLLHHPALTATAVLVHEHETSGQHLVAYVVADGPHPSMSDLRSYMQERVPASMVPTDFVVLPALPMTAHGKVDYQALPSPELRGSTLKQAFVEARNPVEDLLASIWARVLGVERVGIHDNFFAIGGHSLLATQVVARVREAFHCDVPLRSLFEAPTIASLAERIVMSREDEPPAIRPQPRDSWLPLSFAQQRQWFLEQFAPGSPAYTIPLVVRLQGPVRVAVLEASLNEIVRRHESLRTTFVLVEQRPVQHIADTLRLPVAVIDLRGYSSADQQQQVEILTTQETQRPFNLMLGPLLRPHLLRLSEQEHLFLLMVHHIVSDGWSQGVLLRELSTLYQALLQQDPSPLPELPIQYADFALWQRQWFQGEVLQRQLSYWRQQLQGVPLLELSTDFPRPAVQTFQGARYSFMLPKPLSEDLKSLGRREGVTLFMLLLAAFQLLLARYSGQEDLVVGSPIANRTHREVEELIGFFVNTLVLRSRLSESISFRELLAQVREVTLQAYAHQDLPFEQLVEALAPERHLSHAPLVQVLFLLQNIPPVALSLTDVQVEPLVPKRTTIMFDLTLAMIDTEHGLMGQWNYNTDLFEEATIRRMHGHFQTLLEGVVKQPESKLTDLFLLSEAEQLLLLEPSPPQSDPQFERCAHHWFEQQAHLHPDAVALCWDEGQLSYAQLNAHSNQLAHRLLLLGLRPQQPVTLLLTSGPLAVIALLAVLKAGGAFVCLDPQAPQARLQHLLAELQSGCLLTESQLAIEPVSFLQEGSTTTVLVLDQPSLPHAAAQWADASALAPPFASGSVANPNLPEHPEEVAYIAYTSGSTGTPKGIVQSHRNLSRFSTWFGSQFQLGPSKRLAQWASLTFDPSYVEIFAALGAGATLCLPPSARRADPSAFLSWLRHEQITLLQTVPSFWRYLLYELAGPPVHELPHLEFLLAAGEALPVEVAEALLTHVAGPSRLFNLYGPTEATLATCYEVEAIQSRQRSIPIGRPIPGQQLSILDHTSHLCPIGVVGELYIGSSYLASGYFQRPQETEAVFLPNPLPGRTERVYRTGDLARWLPDGTIEFVGRKDHQVKLRGMRVELEEIEAVLLGHVSIQATAVVVQQDELGEQRLVAYVVPASPMLSTTSWLAEVQAFLKSALPDYMVPRSFVVQETLPLTSSGKVDRQALSTLERADLMPAEMFIAPRTPIEEVLAAIFAEVLHQENISIHDDFFAIGGHSLLATQVVARVREAFHCDVPLRTLFEAPTIALLAQSLAAKRHAEPHLVVPPLVAQPRHARLPLSFAQQRLWFLEQFAPDSRAYTIPLAARLSGPLHVEALASSLNEVVRRHESLRTTFTIVDGQPIQVIAPLLRFCLPLIDLQALADSEGEVQRLIVQETWRPFDLEHGPLLRACLLRLHPQEHVFLLTLHHIVSDGWSQGVLQRELSTLYQAFLQQGPSPLPEPPIQYADFALWQRQWLQGEVLQQQMSYWREHLQGVSLLELPTDFPRPAVQTFQGARHSFMLPPPLSEDLKSLGRREGVTLFMLLLAAFQLLLARYSGQEDLIVGSPIANRTHREVEELIGFFVNTLVLRSRLSESISFRELLAQVREVTLQAYAHQDLPFEQLVEALAPERHLSHAPLVQVLFLLQNTPTVALSLPEVLAEPLAARKHTIMFDLTLTMMDTKHGLMGQWNYNTDLFEEATICRLHGHFQTLLEGVVKQPDGQLASLSLLKEPEYNHLLHIGLEPAAAQQYHCPHRLFEQQVRLHPDAIALCWDEGQLSYAQLNAHSNQLAHRLLLLGLRPQQPVALLLTSGPLAVIALLAVLKAAGAFACLDPQAPQARLSQLLTELQPGYLLTESPYASEHGSFLQQGHTGNVLLLDQPSLPDLAVRSADASAHSAHSLNGSTANPDLPEHPEAMAYIAYTSGSTGTPKGIMQSQRNLSQFSSWFGTQFDFGPSKRVAQWAALTFDASSVEIFATLMAGATLCLPRPASRADAPALLDWLDREQITLLQTVPSFLSVLLQTACQQAHSFSSLEFLLVAGEVLPVAVARAALTRFATSTRLFNLYGPTEATLATSYEVKDIPPGQRSIPVGRPIPGRHILILDHTSHLCPIGVVGELYIGSSYLASGYFQRPQETDAVFLPNPLPGQTERVYRTGDLARWLPDGTIEFRGRKDRQIKLRGMRVELEEIEAVLLHHPALTAAAVLVYEHETSGQHLVAYVVAHGAHPSSSDLRSYVQERVPASMVPTDFVVLPALPTTPHGKVDYLALPSPELHGSTLEQAFVEARNPVEDLLASIWARVLGVERVGIHDNFFAIGGHSLLATQVVARVREAFHCDVPLRSLFEAPSIALLAQSLAAAPSSELQPSAPPLVAQLRTASLPLSFAQQRQWFLEQIAPGSPAYTIPLVVRLQGPVQVSVLEASLNEIVRRHESLRTTFVLVEQRPVQHIADTLRLPVAVIDLRGYSADDQQQQVEILTTQETQRPFNLMQGPLLRPHLLRLSEQEHLFLLMMHHIVSDGWSQGVVLRELSVLYQAFLQHHPSPLSPLPIQYADFALWQRDWLQGEVLQRQLSYWREQLQGVPLLELPTDFPRPPVQTFQGARHSFVLPPPLSEELKALGRREGVTLFMALLAAFAALLWRYSGQEDFAIGSPIANRTHVEVEPLIGFFVNTLVLRSRLSESISFRELLAQVREVTLQAYAHQDLPFEQLVEALAPERHLSHAPLVQVLFLLQNTPPVALDLPNMQVEPLAARRNTIMFDLTLTMMDTKQELMGQWNYNTDLFEEATIRRMHGHFQTLLEGVVKQPESKLADLSLLSEAEQLLLLEPSPPQSDPQFERCAHHWFEQQARLHPDAIALCWDKGQLSYAELNAHSNQLAHRLLQLGLRPQQPVALLLTSGPLAVIALLAVLKAGGAFVCLDPQAPHARLSQLLTELQPGCLLTESQYAPEPALVFPQGHTGTILLLDQPLSPGLAVSSTANPDLPEHPEEVAYIAYTSGSTGTPKGIVQSHRNLSRFSTWFGSQFQLGPSKRLAQWAALTFDPSYVEIFAALGSGATLCLPPSAKRADPSAFLIWLRHEQITLLQTVPSFWRYLLHELAGPPVHELPHLEFLLAAGEALPVEVAEALLTHVAGPSRLFNLYGPTEATLATCYEVEAIQPRQRSIPIGRPIAGQQLSILDHTSHLCPIGVVGELYIGSSYLASGYFQRPQETQAVFLPNPLPGRTERVYRTGDLARWLPNGTIEFVGRKDHQVKLRGMRVELEEIETTLLSHVLIQAGAVVVQQDELGEQHLVAYVVPTSPMLSTTSWLAEVQAFLRSALPDYMVPRSFVVQETLPLTSSGKVDRQALSTLERTTLIPAEMFIAPRTPIEEVLAAIFTAVLHREKISIHDDFFAIGGHSLLATQVVARVREAFHCDVPLRTLFEAPTIALLAQSLAAKRHAEPHLVVPPLVAQPRHARLPLSFAQQRLWFLEQFAPDSRAYTIPLAARLSGPLHVAVLERSLNEIVHRHESLRTTFTIVDGQPIQMIAPLLQLSLPLLDLEALADSKGEVQHFIAQEALRSFDLERGPLLRACLLRLHPQEHVFLLTLHHIVSDGWSQGVLLRELSVLYQTLLKQQPLPLPALPIQYVDFALWQRQWLQGEVLQQQLSYWREQLQGVPLLELPTDFPRPPVQTFQGARHSFVLPKALSENLKTFSQQQGATLFMTLLTTFAALLWRYSGQEDFAIGSPIANRTHVEVEPLIGFFVNTLVLRADLSGHPTFLDLLARLRQVTLEAYAHQDVPFEMLVQELSPQRMVSHTPLFQILFMLQNAPHSLLNLPEITVHPLEAASETTKFDLALSLVETEQGLRGLIEYRTDLFEPLRIQRLIGHYHTLLEGIMAHPHVPVADMPLLTAEEQQQFLSEQAISHHDPQDRCVHHLFAEQVARTPEAIALVWQQQHLSYHELNRRAEQLAGWLRSQGVSPEAIVGVALHRCPDLLIAFLGILKAGGAYLPLDPASPPQRLSFIINEACVALVLTARELLVSLPPLHGKVLCLDSSWEQEDQPLASRPLSEARAANLAYVIYTSGSTGQPKGALISHQGLCNLVMAQRRLFGCQGGDRILQSAALSFDASIWEMVLALMSGATLYLPPPEVLLPGSAFIMLLDEQAITTLTLVPSLLAHLPAASLPHLRTLISAGEACPPYLLARWATQRQFFNAYGPTETTVCATLALCHQQMDWLPMGQPLEHIQVYLLDARMHLVPSGTIGELYLGGDSLARGYLQRPDMTAACFVPDPFVGTSHDEAGSYSASRAGARLYKTGDLARYRTDGTLEFVGRRDRQVKWHGYRVELGEIESVLREAEGVREVVVQLVEDGREDKRLVAYIVAEAEADLPTSKLRSYVQAQLPGYMVPSAFIQLAALPLTPSGKIDREALPMPDQYRASRDDAFEAPRTQAEQTIARIWQETLHLQQVSTHDNFFDLGGHSLILVQVHERVREAFDRDISLLDLFTYPTISALAEHLQQKQREKLPLEQSYTRAEIRQMSRQRRRQIARTPPPSPNTQAGREERQVTSDEQ